MQQFNQDTRQKLWSGQISEAEFWLWLQTHSPVLGISAARSLLVKNLYPLPALQMLASWSQLADIHLLSNHRLEWLSELLEPIKPFVKSITISSEFGFCKLDSQIYQMVQQQMENTNKVLFVDDQAKNLLPAVSLGWRTLIADPNSNWAEHIIPLLLA